MALTNKELENAKPKDKKYRLFDGGGLYLEISPAGGKHWRVKYRIQKKEKTLTIGKFPKVSLSEARVKHSEARDLLDQGIDPSAEKQAKKLEEEGLKANTYEAIAREWMDRQIHSGEWGEAHANTVKSRFEKRVYPWIGSAPIDSLTPQDLLKVVKRIEDSNARYVAKLVVQQSSAICQYAIATNRLTYDFAAPLQKQIKRPPVKHYSAPNDPKEVGKILRMLDGYHGDFVVRSALKLAPLFFVRPGELRVARWDQIEGDVWKYKTGKTQQEHIVPLCTQAIEILEELRPLTESKEFVLASLLRNGEPISEGAIGTAMTRIGIPTKDLTPHGFRAMARTLLDEQLGYPPHIIEHQLAHKVKDPLGRAYNRTKHLSQRVEMMQAWADYLDSLRAT